DPRIQCHRGAQCSGDRLELRLDDVVRVPTGQHPHVQSDAGVVGEGLDDVSGERADVLAADDDVLLAGGLTGVHAIGTPGDVHDGLDERLVERDGRVAEPTDAAL